MLSRAASLDLLLARAALVTDMLFYALIPTAATGTLFAIFGMCISLGASFGPVMQSLALELYARRGGSDTGRLLGALTVVSALRYVQHIQNSSVSKPPRLLSLCQCPPWHSRTVAERFVLGFGDC